VLAEELTEVELAYEPLAVAFKAEHNGFIE
jgi:hypothetical protein